MVKKKLLTILTVVLFAENWLYAGPVDKIFTSSGHILPGEEWNRVGIYNDHTVVNMLGGLVDQMETYDASMLNVAGGEIYSLYAEDSSAANIFGGRVGGVMTWDYATANLYDGGSVFSLGARESGVVNMTGGNVKYLGAIESGILNLYGGLVTNSLGAWDFSIVNIYGYSFNYDPTAGRFDGGQLTGFWLDDTPFTIDLYGVETYSHINLVPEPSSLMLFALGALLIKTKPVIKSKTLS